MITLKALAYQLDCDSSPAQVRVGLRIIAERVQMSEIIPYRRKGAPLFFPILGEVCFASGGSGHAFKYRGRHRL